MSFAYFTRITPDGDEAAVGVNADHIISFGPYVGTRPHGKTVIRMTKGHLIISEEHETVRTRLDYATRLEP